MVLINKNGDYGKISRWKLRYEERNRCTTPALDRVQKLFDDIFAVSSARIYGRIEEGLKALEYAEKEYPKNREVQIERLKYDVITAASNGRIPEEKAGELMKQAEALLAKYPGNVDVVKAMGDIYWNSGRKGAATEIYDSIYDNTNDGLIRLDIEKKRRDER